jgi:cell wall-associated NlpC family hydrolase
MQSVKSYVVAGLAALFAVGQAVILATVSGATLVRAPGVASDVSPEWSPPERMPTAVWVGGAVAGVGVVRVDPDHVIVAGTPQRIALRLPAAQREGVGLGAARVALAALGRPYRWGSVGGRAATSGFDCSGLIWTAFASQGVAVPRVSREQARAGVPVPRALSALEAGDLLAFSRVPGGVVEHVGLYVGAGRFVHSSGGDGAVVVSRLAPDDARGRWWWRRWVGARRLATSL